MRLKLLAAYGSGLLVLAVVWAGLAAIEGAEQAQAQVAYAESVRHQCDRLEVAVVEARLSQLALVTSLTSGKTPRSQPHAAIVEAAESARTRVTGEFAILSTLVMENPEQRARVDALGPQLDALLVGLKDGIAIVAQAESLPLEGALSVLVALYNDDLKRENATALREGIAAIADREAIWLEARREVRASRQTVARLVLVVGGALAFVLITWIITRIRGSVAVMASAQRTIQAQNRALAGYTRDLERMVAELDQYAYVASHDLKAPLRGISNLAEWLEEDCGEALAPEGREHLRLLRQRVKQMEAMVEGVLAYARAGRDEAAVEEVQVEALVREVLDLVAAQAEVELSGTWPTLQVERSPFQQIWLNLVSNAVKYGRPDPQRPARIRLSAERGEGVWRFSVSDEGPGIDPRHHQKVFGLFQTLTPSDARSTGIGLAIVKKLVERQGGTIEVRSAPGEGTTFSFTYPSSEAAASRVEARPKPLWRWRER